MAAVHRMRLDVIPFEATKLGKKTLEVRLFDSRRAAICIGDFIEFSELATNELLRARVNALSKYATIEDLIAHEPFKNTGGIYSDQDEWKKAICNYYSEQDRNKFGLVAIHMTRIAP